MHTPRTEANHTEELRRRQELHDQHKARIWEDIQSSTDSFDQGLLTLSSGALGLSLAFIKDIVPLKDAIWVSLLFASWIAFTACIVTTVISFLASVEANKQQLGYIDEYYIAGNDTALDKHTTSGYVKALRWCTRAAIFFFVAGLFCTVVFSCVNVVRFRMSENKGKDSLFKVQEGRRPLNMTPVKTQDGRQPLGMTPANPQEVRGRQPLNMTPSSGAPLEKGRQPVGMTPIKPAQPSQPEPSDSGVKSGK